jgi:CMP/dCMP kinase
VDSTTLQLPTSEQPTADELKNVVTLDGGNQTGKTTLAQRVAERFGLNICPSGKIYRGIAYLCVEMGVNQNDEAGIRDILARYVHHMHIQSGDLFIYTEKMTDEHLRLQAVTDLTYNLSPLPYVREALMPLQRTQAAGAKGLVAEGRDMGTKVFPEARVKFFLTCDIDERIRRTRGTETRESLLERDLRDEKRHHSPMVPAIDAIKLDTTHLTPIQVADIVTMECIKLGFALASDARRELAMAGA